MVILLSSILIEVAVPVLASYMTTLTVQIFGNDDNKSKPDSGGN
jgi:hypothetical protein